MIPPTTPLRVKAYALLITGINNKTLVPYRLWNLKMLQTTVSKFILNLKNPNYKKIVESSLVNIKFYIDSLNLCTDLMVWKADNIDKFVPQHEHTIRTDVELGNPLDVSSWFQIKHVVGYNYKLVFCLDIKCHNIGTVRQNCYNHFVILENPVVFNFKLYPHYGKAQEYLSLSYVICMP
ncbi:hypothetical protein H5410_061976 [Solanum commersonii]|uniref:Uncharacterized protein n=1 Tax=Solanum commersonii TaxID=4109 RepID=A0A9J5W9H7_SOLCO|nr:hypothetical protein H5410_061976 [Solanum commersonii]